MSSTLAAPPPEAPSAPPAVSPLTRWRVLVGAIVVQLILGTVYGYSIFWKPLESAVFQPFVSQSEQATLAAGNPAVPVQVVLTDAVAKSRHESQTGLLTYAFALCILTFALTMVAAGRVQDRKGPRFTALIGAVLLGLGFVLGGLVLGDGKPQAGAETSKLVLLWLTVGLIAGAGIGFAYVCPIAALVKWFPQAKGLVSGLAVAGFGFGAFIFSAAVPKAGATGLLNEVLRYLGRIGGPGFIDAYGVRMFFVVHGLVSLVAVALGALMLTNPPGTPARAAVADSDWKGTLRQPAFMMLWLMFFSGALAGLMVIGIVKLFAGEQLVAGQVASGVAMTPELRKTLMAQGAAAVGALAVFNAIGRVLWGIISDRVGRTGAFVAMFALQAVTMFLLASTSTQLTVTIAACAVGFNFGGNFALFPSATADLFGARNMGANYGMMFTSYGIAGVAGIYAGNFAKSATGSYTAAFTVAGGMCVLSAVLALVLHSVRRRALASAEA